jgi:ATPase subunit of ABC transporter with duplicated ATPase domains
MSQIVVSHLTFSYPTSPIDVLTEVSLSLSVGWYGIVGPNGSGKTTLLRILAGELAVDPASLSRIPSDLATRYCPQRVSELNSSIRSFAASNDRNARRLFGKLALTPADLARWPSLSPGERKRWQVAAALADAPGLLLLDEPTNHLDSEAKQLLFDMLNQYRGIGILVSHDRLLLDSLTTGTIKIRAGGLVCLYTGNYSVAREQWEMDEKQKREQRERLQAERRKLKRRLDTARRSREKAESGKSTAKRMKGMRDSDARSMGAKGRVAAAEQKLGREVEVLRRKLGDAENKVDRVRVEKEIGRPVFVLEDAAPTPNLVTLRREEISRAGRILIRDLDVIIRRDSRIHLKGANGSGKTTLIQELLKSSRLPEQRMLYLPQELSNRRIEDNRHKVDAMPGSEKGRLLQIVAALGVPPERMIASDRPSPGEARKLALAMGLSRQAWLLMLDEPTNHLDLPSIERLEQALTQYSCALLIVSHDERFTDSVTRETWTIEQQRLVKS